MWYTHYVDAEGRMKKTIIHINDRSTITDFELKETIIVAFFLGCTCMQTLPLFWYPGKISK